MKKNIKFYDAARMTLKKKDKDFIEEKLAGLLERSKVYKRAEVTTIGDAYYNTKFKGKKLLPLTTMHVARFLKR